MSKTISILDMLFNGCETAEDVASRIKYYQPEYDELTSLFNSKAENEFANRVLSLARNNDSHHRAEGAVRAGANRSYIEQHDDLHVLRGLCIRLGLGIDGLNPSHDPEYCY